MVRHVPGPPAAMAPSIWLGGGPQNRVEGPTAFLRPTSRHRSSSALVGTHNAHAPRRIAGPMVRCTAALQTRRTITAVYLVWRCRSFAFWQLVSKKRWPRGWHFERPCATTRCGPDLRCPNAPPSDSVAPTTCWLPGGRHFSGQQRSGEIWALRLHPARVERTHGSCWQVSRPGSLAAR